MLRKWSGHICERGAEAPSTLNDGLEHLVASWPVLPLRNNYSFGSFVSVSSERRSIVIVATTNGYCGDES